MDHSLADFARDQGLPLNRSCAVCQIDDVTLIAVVDDNERKSKTNPTKVPRRVVAAYLQSMTNRPITGDMVSSHAARHVKEIPVR